MNNFNEETFKRYKELEDRNIDFTTMYFIDSLNNSLDFLENINQKEKIDMLNIIYRVWLKDEQNISISTISDKVVNKWEKIEENKNLTTYEIIDLIDLY